MSSASAPQISNDVCISMEELAQLRRYERRATKQKEYVKKYHLSDKGRAAKAKAQRKYREKQKAKRRAEIEAATTSAAIVAIRYCNDCRMQLDVSGGPCRCGGMSMI